MGPDAAFVNQDLKAPVHPIVAIDKRLCHDRPISLMIPQDILQHPKNGAIYEVAKNEFGKHGVGKNNKHKDEKNPHGSNHGAVHNMAHKGAGHDKYGQNEIRHNELPLGGAHGYHGTQPVGHTQDNYDPNQHTGVRNAIHEAAHPTSQNEYHQNQYGQTRDGYDPSQHTEARNMMHDAAHPTTQNQYGQSQYGQNQYGQNQEAYDPNQHSGVRNAIHDAAHPTGQYDRNDTHNQHGVIGVGQTKLGHNEIGHNKHGLGNNLGKHGKGALMFDLASMPLNDRDDRVLKDSNGKPIAYLTEKNRIIQRNFVITRDPEGQDAIFDVKRKHLSKSPVRADFKDLVSGRMCRLGASVLEETHGITALLWLDNGDGTKEKLPVGRLHLPPGSNRNPNVMRATEDHHKMTDALRPVTKQQNKDADGQRSKDYQLDLMPGIDSGLAVLVAMVTAACTDHKRATDPSTHSGVTPVKHSNTA